MSNFSGLLEVDFPRCRHFDSLSLLPFQISTTIPCFPSQDQRFLRSFNGHYTRANPLLHYKSSHFSRFQYSTRCASCFPLFCFRSSIPEFLVLVLDRSVLFRFSMKVNTQNGGTSLSRLRVTSEPTVSVLLCHCTSALCTTEGVNSFGH